MTVLHPRLADRLRGAAISALGGAAVSSFYGMAAWPHGFGTIVVIGAVVGTVVYITINALNQLLRGPLGRLPPAARLPASLAVFVFGGAFGAIVGSVIGARIMGRRMGFTDLLTGRGQTVLVSITAISLAAALLFREFDRLKSRVRENAVVENELQMARDIQMRLLPQPRMVGEGFVLSARNLPAHFVAGDFYDFVRNDDGSVTIVVADVAGKGMAAALIMASVKAVLPFVARQRVPDAMLTLNTKLLAELPKREFVALVCARFDPRTRSVELANAGCPDPYIVRRTGAEPLTISGVRLPLGLRAGVFYDTRTVTLKPGERLLMLSDGIPEAPRPNGDPLGYDELARMIGATDPTAHGEAWLDQLLAQVRAVTGAQLADDWTAVLLELTAPTPST